MLDIVNCYNIGHHSHSLTRLRRGCSRLRIRVRVYYTGSSLALQGIIMMNHFFVHFTVILIFKLMEIQYLLQPWMTSNLASSHSRDICLGSFLRFSRPPICFASTVQQISPTLVLCLKQQNIICLKSLRKMKLILILIGLKQRWKQPEHWTVSASCTCCRSILRQMK